jgi:endoglucanase
MHHYRQLDGDPLDRHERPVDPSVVDERFLSMWWQIATRYRRLPHDRLLFELYNEPHNRLTVPVWNLLLARAHDTVRKVDRQRMLVIGPVDYNDARQLNDLVLPPHDDRLIATVHNYEPKKFTHQGASWVPGSEAWVGTQCCDSEQLIEAIRPLEIARAWSDATARPIWVGEFGSHERADYASRVRYTRALRDAIEARGFSWAYWELAANFGIWDPKLAVWRVELKDALLG